MIYIKPTSINPYYNLAMEEYALKNLSDDIFMLWQNEDCIVIGRNQNTLEEIDYDYVKENNIKIVRRMSGGGAVFHDLGNINFTFIENNADSFSDYEKFTKPIIDYLNSIGVKAYLEGRNDLLIDGMKFSGNAQYVYKNRTLHHGTLLFDASMVDLSKALKVNPLKIKSKGIKSVSKRVTNISSHLKEKISVDEFIKDLEKFIINNYKNIKVREPFKEEINEVLKLKEEKYDTWEWNFGSSPKYTFTKEEYFPFGLIKINMDVDKGSIIKDVKITGDFFGKKDISILENALIGKRHELGEMKNALANFNINDYFLGMSMELFVTLLI